MGMQIGKGGIGIKRRLNLINARIDRGMTQADVAKELGIGLRSYKQLEYAERTGNVEYWDKLEEMFNVHQRTLREVYDQVAGR